MLLVTGATGFIGGHLVAKLAAAGEPVRCLVRRAIPPGLLPPSAEIALADLGSGRGVEEALRGVDTVIHLAGVTKALRAADYYAGNAHASGTLARAVAGRQVRFVHVSSLAAAGPGEMIDEAREPRPVSEYGKSKLAAERIVRDALPGAAIVRPPVVYGPKDDGVFQMLKPVARGRTVEIAGGDRMFSAIFVGDLVEGLLVAARDPRAEGRTYFMAHRQPASWRELFAAAARAMGKQPPKVYRVPLSAAWTIAVCLEGWGRLRRRPSIVSRDKILEARQPSWTCDPKRAREELGFEAQTGLEEGLAVTLAWYKEAGWLKY